MPALQPSLVSGNYLKMMVRSFYRNRSYTLLNLAGLSLGFAVFIFAVVYVHFETSFESFHHQAENMYRVTYRYTPGDSPAVQWARVPFDYINELPQEVPGVQTLIRFQNQERKYIRIGQEKFRPAHVYVTDKEVFNVFDFKLLAGNPATALASPHAVVLSQSLAVKYFGDRDPLGQEVYVIGDLDQTETLHRVTGVMADVPAHTHLPADMLISFKDKAERSGWAYTYVLLQPGASAAQVASQLPAFIRNHSDENDARKDALVLQPLRSIHLHSDLAREIVPNGKIFYVRVVAVAGILILIIAMINFMNLSSAMALGRAKEIGMRKVLGASRHHLVGYLLTESVIHNLVAALAGAGIAYMAFPWFQQFVTVRFMASPALFALAIAGVAIVCGVLSGIYPVMLLVALKPMEVVRATKALSFARRESPLSLKRVMVTLQFCVSILLLGSALIAYNQFQFLQRKNLGMTREQIVAIPGVPDNVKNQYAAFKQQLLSQKGIVQVAACMEVPSREIRDMGPVLVEGVNTDVEKAPVMDIQVIDHDFATVLGLELLAGKNIPETVATVPEFTEAYTLQQYLRDQRRAYLINETAMRQLGWQTPQEAIGNRISWSIGDMVLAPGPVAGVVRDFHQETLKNKVDPIVLVNEPVWLRTVLIKVETQQVQASVASIQSVWDRMFPFYPLEYYFLDDLYNNLYKGERVQLQLLFVFSGLAIVIAFIGLVGLVAYALKTRAKEIAVRKVLGATAGDLVRLMSREYLVVLLIGATVAIPASVYGVNQWLAGFAYRTHITPASYVLALASVVVLLLLTISLQTFRAAASNTADTLRDE